MLFCSWPNPMIPKFGIFQNTGTNYKASATHKLKPSPVGSDTQNPNPLGIPSFNTITQPFPCPFLSPFPAIWPKMIYFSLIRQHHPLPAFQSPIFVPGCKFHSFFCDRWGLFFFTTAFFLVLLRCLDTVCEVTGWLVIVWSALDNCTAVSAFPEVISLIAWHVLAGESLTGWLPEDL